MATSIDDEHLVAAHRAGDQQAFADLVRTHRPALYRHAMRCLHDPAAAEDAVQETLARAYRSLHRVEGEYRLGSWLHRILANVCIDEANRRRREADKLGRVAFDRRNLELVPGVEEELGFDSGTSGVREALASLPAPYREALSLRFVDELSYDELAARSGVSEQNARARVSRARQAMRMALKGVAALPLVALVGLRRGHRAAQAADSGQMGSTGAGAASQAVQATHAVSAVPQALDAATNLAVNTPQAVPLLAKAAVGVGAVAMAVLPSPPSRELAQSTRTVAAPPSSQVEQAAPAATASDAVSSPSPTGPADAPHPSSGSMAPAVEVPTTLASVVTDAPFTSEAPALVTAPSEVPVESVPAEPVASPAPETSAPVDSAPALDTTVAPTRSSGSVSFTSLTVTPAGPRFDVAGAATLSVADQFLSGSMSGRLAVDVEPLGDGTRRFDGVLTLTLDDGSTLEVLLAGRAVGVDPGDGTMPTSYSLSGSFQATWLAIGAGGEIPLVMSGSLEGTIATLTGGSWQLVLSG